MVEHPDSHLVLATPSVDVPEEGSQRRVNGECDAAIGGMLSELAGKLPVHPEAIAQVDLAGIEPFSDEDLDRIPGVLPRWNRARPDPKMNRRLHHEALR